MPIVHQLLELETGAGICIYNITDKVQQFIQASGIQAGQALIMSRHTTTAVAVNEDEERLLKDVTTYLQKLAPESDRYLHNDLHLRVGIPDDEPMNAHSHLMAMTLSNSQIIAIIDGKLALGTYQSILLFELDGPRQRTVLCQLLGE
jgi:secondary thiamine-phosphate synthase enzyme